MWAETTARFPADLDSVYMLALSSQHLLAEMICQSKQ